MMIDALGGVAVDLADQNWFEGDDWMLSQPVDRVEEGTSRHVRRSLRELVLMKKIIDSGRRRRTRSGRFHAVFVAREFAKLN
jgi:hypothetical protein